MTISPGATVQITGQRGTWVVAKQTDIDRRWWRCVGKDAAGRTVTRIAGAGDVTLITPARSYTPGSSITLDGVRHEAISDNGDTITLEVPASVYRAQAGINLQRSAGNTIAIAKSDLVLEGLQRTITIFASYN